MKKLMSLLLVLTMLFALVACGTTPDETSAPAGSNTPTGTTPVQTTDPGNNEPELLVDTCILKEADDKMLNTYSVIAVNDAAPFVDADGNAVSDVALNTAGADALYQWLVSQAALDMAGSYGV